MVLTLNGSTDWPDRKALTALGQTKSDLPLPTVEHVFLRTTIDDEKAFHDGRKNNSHAVAEALDLRRSGERLAAAKKSHDLPLFQARAAFARL